MITFRQLLLWGFLLIVSSCFCQGSFGPSSRWVYDYDNSVFNGITQVQFEETVDINGFSFNKFQKEVTQARFGFDTIQRMRSPIYFLNQDDIILVSFEGTQVDTMFNFNAAVGDQWELAHPNTSEVIVLEVLDVFDKRINDVNLVGQLLSYSYSDSGRRFIDTVLNYVGNTFGYIDPFEFILSSPDSNEGGDLRCFDHPNIGVASFNVERDFTFDFVCEELTSTSTIGTDTRIGRLEIKSLTLNGLLELECSTCQQEKFVVYDVFGRIIKNGFLMRGYNQIWLGEKPSGFFLLHVNGRKPVKIVSLK